MSIKENWEKISEEVEEASVKSGRNPEEIKIVAVSKTFPPEVVSEAAKAGATDFGENYVQDFLTKYEALKDSNIKWHFIGHLQSNKIKYIFDKIYMIHTLDSIKLAESINKKLKNADKKLKALIQVNIGEEKNKFGIDVSECERFLEKMQNFTNLRIEGLMTIPPYFTKAEKVRPYFAKMKKLFEKLKKFNSDNIDLKELSMGMSNDFKIAIEEGATIVRIGTAVFGARACKVDSKRNVKN